MTFPSENDFSSAKAACMMVEWLSGYRAQGYPAGIINVITLFHVRYIAQVTFFTVDGSIIPVLNQQKNGRLQFCHLQLTKFTATRTGQCNMQLALIKGSFLLVLRAFNILLFQSSRKKMTVG